MGVDQYLTAADLARKLRVTVRQIYRLRAQGDLPRAVKIGRALRWKESDVSHWLARKER